MSTINVIFLILAFQVEDAVKDVTVEVAAGTPATKVMAVKVDTHRKALEKEYLGKSDLWTSAYTKSQSAQDQKTRYETKVDKQKRALGQTCFNQDGTLSFLSGFGNQSHLRQPLEIIRELLRYVETEMLKLRQNRVESLLIEFVESLNHDLLVGRHTVGSREYFELRQNLWAAQSVQASLTRRQGLVLSKADLTRKMVRIDLLKLI